jgi:glycosyltransferase involved in cell wall biosynthesis
LLHVLQISFFMDPQDRAPQQLLEAWPTLVDVAECAASAGVRVSVIQASGHTQRLQRANVNYHFLPCARADRSGERRVALGALLRELAPQVLHVQGLGFARDVSVLAALAPGVPIVLQDHADRPPRFWRRGAWRRGAARVDALAFCAREQAQPFAAAGLVNARTRVFEIPESSCRFMPGDREAARRVTGARGAPLVLWVGHLNDNKDPLTVLAGVSAAARSLPALRLWCCFAEAPLLPVVTEQIQKDPALRGRVHLLGRVTHEAIEQLMRAADMFVLGSHHEGSGYSLIEALACGLPPVVTDIASFRALTGAGSVGQLWPCADANALCAALIKLAAVGGPCARAAVRAHFDRELSFAAVGAKLAAMYQDLSRTPGRCARTGAGSDLLKEGV